jgi:hypothetical protein
MINEYDEYKGIRVLDMKTKQINKVKKNSVKMAISMRDMDSWQEGDVDFAYQWDPKYRFVTKYDPRTGETPVNWTLGKRWPDDLKPLTQDDLIKELQWSSLRYKADRQWEKEMKEGDF